MSEQTERQAQGLCVGQIATARTRRAQDERGVPIWTELRMRARELLRSGEFVTKTVEGMGVLVRVPQTALAELKKFFPSKFSGANKVFQLSNRNELGSWFRMEVSSKWKLEQHFETLSQEVHLRTNTALWNIELLVYIKFSSCSLWDGEQ